MKLRVKQFLLTTFSLLLATMMLQAQTGTVSGTISDADGALVGASVSVAGTSTGTTTDVDGSYSLTLNAGSHTLVVSYIGYESTRRDVNVTAGGKTTADFLLASGVLLNDIVVTGTRSNPRTTLSSPVPIDNFPSAMLERQGNGDLTETLKNLVPSFSATPLTGDGSAFVRPTSLRGLPPDETLILVNSKRRHRSSLIAHFGAAMNVGAHAADIGQIPSIALKNVEVLRDGAAAQYGSDAIAGVMNFILKDANEGVEVQAQVGKWYGRNYGSETDYKVGINFGLPLTSKGFINVSGEYSFNDELSRGDQHAAAQAAIDSGIEGVQDPAMNWGRPKSSGFRSTWNAGIELADNVEFYSFGNFADTYGNYSFFYRAPNHAALMELPNNPNDPSEGNFCWCDQFPAGFTPEFEGFQTDFSTISGIRGTIGDGFNYDLSATYGFNKLEYVLNNSLNPSWGPHSQTVFRPGDLQQEEVNVNAQLSKEFGEKVNVAVGFESRKETYTMFVGEQQAWAAGPWAGVSKFINPETGENYAEPSVGANGFSGTGQESAGIFESKNWASYIDVEFDITEAWLLQLAFRHEDYKTFGSTDNFKVATRYTVADWLTVRGAYSTGFRAPTPGQANVTTITTSFDGVTGMQVQEGTVRPTDPLAVALGGKALVPEEAENFSFGIASRISGSLSLTLDVYQVNVDKRIIKSRSLPVVGNPDFAEVAFYSNSLNTETQGLDAVLVWRNNATSISLAYNYNDSKVVSQEQVNGEDPVSAGTIFNIENNLPKSRASFSINHDFGKLSAMVRANYYGSAKDERGGNVGEDHEEVGGETLLDIELSYPITDNMRFILGANNVLDNYPDMINTRVSQGMPFPRRTPIGYHGGMVYFKAVYKI